MLDVANRLAPKSDRVLLHSTIDLEDGVLALLEELTVRGLSATVLVEDAARAGRVRSAVPGSRVRTIPRRSARGVAAFLTSRWVVTTESLYGFFRSWCDRAFQCGDMTRQEVELILGMSHMWGAYVGDCVELQSLKYFYLEDCIEGGKLGT